MNEKLRIKFFCAAAAVMSAGATVSAQTATFAEFPSEAQMQTTGGCQVAGMSTNGRYLTGGTYVAGGFIYDVEAGEMKLISASGVAHNGDAVTGAGVVNIHTGKLVYALERPSSSYTFLMTTGISGDGHVVTGTGGEGWTNLNPLCWVDGKLVYLPFPSTAEVKTFKVNGCRANGVSDDGSVIWGCFIANPNTNNLIIWERQPDGSYDYVDVWTDIYEPQHGWVYDYDSKTYDFVRGPNPYCRVEPYAMSGDGRLILIRTQENTEEESPANKVGIFHVESRTLELAPWSSKDIIGQARDFDSRGIANDGTVVGIARESTLSDAIPFIMFPGEGPQYLNDVFPQFDRLGYYEACSLDFGLPYLLTVISEDARYIGGYSTDIIYYANAEGQLSRDFGFWGFVIDMNATDTPSTDGVEAPEVALEDATAEFYTVDGFRVAAPEKGRLYIRRSADGKTAKVVY